MVYRTRNGFEMSDGGTDQFEMQSKEADSKSAEDIAQTSSQGNDQYNLLKWGATSRWSFRPNSELGRIETTIIAKTHPS